MLWYVITHLKELKICWDELKVLAEKGVIKEIEEPIEETIEKPIEKPIEIHLVDSTWNTIKSLFKSIF